MDVPAKRLRRSEAFSGISALLIDYGYDIKNSNEGAGIITTEYRKVASSGTSPPFDYYLQIRITIRESSDGTLLVRMMPAIKEQNRLNPVAFTEHELGYYSGNQAYVNTIASQGPGGWRQATQTAFVNVVEGVARLAGVSLDDVHRNTTSTQTNAIGAN